ncbi:TetR/AcrR family transcriptional regulator [Streptomyces sp. S1]|uniref:TetR/AcrR family transcriptional regulator n=1 Tax=unclassified Streptomyces TaxID=2593676 RepID=UPI000EF7BB4E
MEQDSRLGGGSGAPEVPEAPAAPEGGAAPAPGARRPGGRTAKVRRAVLDATQEALAASGFHALNMDRIAAGAGVGKTTVYRRWGSPAALVADLLDDMAEQSLPAADTGGLAGDLRANAALVLETLTDPRMSPVFRAVIAAAACDEECARALGGFYRTRLAEWAPVAVRAEARGELPPGTDPLELLRAVSAPLYYRFAVTHEELTPADAERAVTATLAAAAAGAFVPDGP